MRKENRCKSVSQGKYLLAFFTALEFDLKASVVERRWQAPTTLWNRAWSGVRLHTVELSHCRIVYPRLLNATGFQSDVSADGQHFLAVMPNESGAPEPLTLVQNWPAALKK